MADDDKQTPPATGDAKPAEDDKELGDGGKKALEAERKARKAAEKDAKDLAARLKEIEDKDKSDGDKLREELEAEKKARAAAESRVMRLEVAIDKGLDDDRAKRLVSQSKRLQGDTREELEADADDFFSSFATEDKGKPPSNPRERLRGGGEPTDEPEETDPAKLAEKVSSPI